MKKQFIKIIILSSISLLFSEMKIGYVNANEVLADFDDARQVQVQIEKEEKRLQAELESKIMKRDSLAMDYEKKMILLDEDGQVPIDKIIKIIAEASGVEGAPFSVTIKSFNEYNSEPSKEGYTDPRK